MNKFIFSIAVLTISSLLFTSNIFGASGVITDINPAGKAGKILRQDDGSNNLYVFTIRDLEEGYSPNVGDAVTFDPIRPPVRKAINVEPVSGGDGGGDTGGGA